MSTELFLNFLGIRMDSRRAEGMRFTMNLLTPDNGEKFIVEMENATLTNVAGFQANNPDLILTINRSDLEQTMMGTKTLDAQIADGTAHGGCHGAGQARLDHDRFRPSLRDHAGDESEGRRKDGVGPGLRSDPASDYCGVVLRQKRSARKQLSSTFSAVSFGGHAS
jgi:hypothetical protein